MKKEQDVPENTSVGIVVPNRNGRNHLAYSIPSICELDYDNYQVVVVDGASQDDSVPFIKTNWPKIKVLVNNDDRGFAANVNTGVQYFLESGLKYIVVFSNDVKVKPDWLKKSIEIIQKEGPSCGMLGFKEFNRFQTEEYDRYAMNQPIIETEKVSTLPCGAIYLCRSDLFKEVGLYDEAYYMYGEDNDFFSRICRSRFRIHESNIPIWHYGEGSSEHFPFKTIWLVYRNAVRYALKNETPKGFVHYIAAFLNRACNPFLAKSSSIKTQRRVRPFWTPINFLLFLLAVAWNFFHLPEILKARRLANKRLNKLSFQ